MERFIPISPAILGMQLGAAIDLYMFLVDKQTSADGLVFYGKPIGYQWIAHHWPGEWGKRPAIRSLKRQMETLRKRRLAKTRREWHGGIVVRVLESVKFGEIATPAVQLPLFGATITAMRRPVDKPVGKQRVSCESPDFNSAKSGPLVVPKVAR